VTTGEYVPASRILSFPCDGMDGHLPITIVIHETIHMLDYERVYPPGARPARWFEEGLASYFRFSHLDSRLRIDPGSIRRSGTIISGKVRLQFDPRANLLDYLRRVADDPVPLRGLLEERPGAAPWWGPRAADAYGASWTLVHFLLHADKGLYVEPFRKYASLEARGAGGTAAFESQFGGDLAPLEKAWHDYEARL
jgi:hypothetical protein